MCLGRKGHVPRPPNRPPSSKSVQNGSFCTLFLFFAPKLCREGRSTQLFAFSAENCAGGAVLHNYLPFRPIFVQTPRFRTLFLPWRRWRGTLAQVPWFFGAGVTFGGRPAPFYGPQAHFVVQVPYLKPHLRQIINPPVPEGRTTCAKNAGQPRSGMQGSPFFVRKACNSKNIRIFAVRPCGGVSPNRLPERWVSG